MTAASLALGGFGFQKALILQKIDEQGLRRVKDNGFDGAEVDGIGVGASFAELPPEDGERVFMLYFTGSYSDIARLPDMDHDAVVRTACGQKD